MSVIITFKPRQVTKQLLFTLSPRAKEVITNRYGLGRDTQKMTLEAIGNQYGITRERVRQIENAALGSIKKSDIFLKEAPIFDELVFAIDSLGGIISENELLELIPKDKNTQNHILLLLTLGDAFNKKKEDNEFKHHWYTDENLRNTISSFLYFIFKSFTSSKNAFISSDSETRSSFERFVYIFLRAVSIVFLKFSAVYQ